MNIEDKIRSLFKDRIVNKIQPLGLKKLLDENLDVKEYCEQKLKEYPEYETIRNFLISFIENKPLLKCEKCGNYVKFSKTRWHKKEHVYCSRSCMPNNFNTPTANAKRLRTLKERYGENIINPFQIKQVKDKIKQTCLEKYGETSFSKSDNFKKIIQQVYKNKTDDEKEKILEKRRKTTLEKYHVEYLTQSLDILRKGTLKSSYNNLLKNFKNYVEPMFSFDEWEGYKKEYEWKCIKCGNIFKQKLYHTKHISRNPGYQFIPRCLNCYPILSGASYQEKEVAEFCKKFYPNLIENDRQLIKPLELDIVIPEKKLAIEFNGSYWHSFNSGTPIDYHLMKTELCKNIGYRLIHIFDFDWHNNKNVVKYFLTKLLLDKKTKVFDEKTYKISEISKNDSINFLTNYSLQQIRNSSIQLGLFENNELRSVITFSKLKHNWKISNFECENDLHLQKMIFYFRIHHKEPITVFIDKRNESDKIFIDAGFQFVNTTNPSPMYTRNYNISFNYKYDYDIVYDCGADVLVLR